MGNFSLPYGIILAAVMVFTVAIVSSPPALAAIKTASITQLLCLETE